MSKDELYESNLIKRLDETRHLTDWLEGELREVRNRMSRNKHVDVIDWSGDKPKFASLGEWIK